MRTVVVKRSTLAQTPFELPDGCPFDAAEIVDTLDRFSIPDGFAFITDDDGTLDGCKYLNQYLFDAHDQRAYDAKSLREFHMYNLGRLLRYLRRSRADEHANREGISVSDWLAAHGEPKVDLTDATRTDLQAYAAARAKTLAPTTLQTEFSCLINFYRYAVEKEWMKDDPVPRWNGRSTLVPRVNRTKRVSKFLTGPQTTHFLSVGLRADGAPPNDRPASPERDYCYGLLLATTGLRREEAGLLLDRELPYPKDMPADGVHAFERSGKGGVARYVYVTEEAARAVDLYRQTERATKIAKAQPLLHRKTRTGELLVTDGLTTFRGKPAVIVGGRKVPLVNFSDEDRARAVYANDDGTIEPLGLFLAQGGLPPSLKYWDDLFRDARNSVAHGQDRVRTLMVGDPPTIVTVVLVTEWVETLDRLASSLDTVVATQLTASTGARPW